MKLNFFLTALFLSFSLLGFSQDAKEILRKADEKMRGINSSTGTMKMTIVRPTWKRERAWLRKHGRELHAVRAA